MCLNCQKDFENDMIENTKVQFMVLGAICCCILVVIGTVVGVTFATG